jgi:hypothetical protein
MVFWYAEQAGGTPFKHFKTFLREIYSVLLDEARRVYFKRKRFTTFETYLNRIYLAYFMGVTPEHRMSILYQDSPKKVSALVRMHKIQADLKVVMMLPL